MKKAKWAFLSVGGSITKRFVVEAMTAQNAELAAVCSRDLGRAKAFADEHGILDAYGSYEELLGRPDIDIIYAAPPNNLHAIHSIMCMDAGKSVVCEKPMARSMRETEIMIEKAREKNVFLMEGLWTNFFPASKKMHEWLSTGRIGKPLFLQASFGVGMPDEILTDRNGNPIWQTTVKNGGGSICDIGLYCIALSIDVMGGTPDEIQTFASRYANGTEADSHNAMIFRHGVNGVSHLSSSFISRMPTEAVIHGEKGSIKLGKKFWQPDRAELFIYKGDFFWDEPEEVFVDPYIDGSHEGFKYEIEAVSRYVLEGKKQAAEVSWDYSVRLADVMEKVRAKWDIVYPDTLK